MLSLKEVLKTLGFRNIKNCLLSQESEVNVLQDLLLMAHSKEAKKLEEEERIRRALDEKFPSEAPTEVCMSTASLHFCRVYYLTGKINFYSFM